MDNVCCFILYFRLSTNYFILLLVGETNDTDAKVILSEIKKLNADKKFINVVGFVEHDDILKYYIEADYYVFPSLCETFGLPKHEAEQIGLQYYS